MNALALPTRRATSHQAMLAASALAFVLSLVPPVLASAATTTAPSRIDPALWQAIQQAPASVEQIIIQKTTAGNGPEQAVKAVGGSVTAEIPALRMFAASVGAKSVGWLSSRPGVRVITLNAKMTDKWSWSGHEGNDPVNSTPTSDYLTIVGAPLAQNSSFGKQDTYRGTGVTVGVMDSGISNENDFNTSLWGGGSRLTSQGLDVSQLISDTTGLHVLQNLLNSGSDKDQYGHGTHVAGIIAGHTASYFGYNGIAPSAGVTDMHVGGGDGSTSMIQAIQAVMWGVQNRQALGLRVINISMASGVASSYLNDPLDAAVEMAWAAGITVICSAGNSGANTAKFAPGNDPYVITVGALDPNGSTDPTQMQLAPFSSYGTTLDGFTKPEIVAPGTHIISTMDPSAKLYHEYPNSVYKSLFGNHYFRMSGTSMAAPIVSGAAALYFSKYPNATPDQFKYALLHSATKLPQIVVGAGAGMVYIPALLQQDPSTVPPLMQAYPHSAGLDSIPLTMSDGKGGTTTIAWSNIAWANVVWGKNASTNIAWSNIAWANTANSNIAWANISWSNIAWSNIAWSNISWANIAWSSSASSNIAWGNIAWSNISWANIAWSNVAEANIAWSLSAGGN